MTASAYPGVTSHMPKNSYRPTKKTNKLVIFSILRHNLSKNFTQTGLYCSKKLLLIKLVKNRCISSLKHLCLHTQKQTVGSSRVALMKSLSDKTQAQTTLAAEIRWEGDKSKF